MATFNKFNHLAMSLAKGQHRFGEHVFKVMLTNTLPSATSVQTNEIAEISLGNGYVKGGIETQISLDSGINDVDVQGTEVKFVASGGNLGFFRYAVLYNESVDSVTPSLIGWWDYSSSIMLSDTESLTVRFNGNSTGSIFKLACVG